MHYGVSRPIHIRQSISLTVISDAVMFIIFYQTSLLVGGASVVFFCGTGKLVIYFLNFISTMHCINHAFNHHIIFCGEIWLQCSFTNTVFVDIVLSPAKYPELASETQKNYPT